MPIFPFLALLTTSELTLSVLDSESVGEAVLSYLLSVVPNSDSSPKSHKYNQAIFKKEFEIIKEHNYN